ncbi:hypothetical protein N836_22755 [Leptolyngbya sp. Heron Island J]|uniref:hypothetical protein n=1 Tax=Leptolyngbya sp. Heron Island J TaxID=1385935 RepID=UPI0003B9E033|nr:hypothetical protein [Leptolyngbya sp. Heron Island J]ESA33215.1 hypothetical protein N836_22755 [Leptolyngbya sp. Heron Island J]
MNIPPSNHQKRLKVPRRFGQTQSGVPWPWLMLVMALHIGVGLFLSMFSPPFWVWPLAFAGTLIQALALAGPKALSAFKGIRILLLRFLTCLGVGLSVVALAIAVGFGGTADIDNIQFVQTGLTLFFVNLGVLVLTAGCSVLIAYVGDRMLANMGRIRSSLSVLSVCFLGLFVGGAFGLAIAS